MLQQDRDQLFERVGVGKHLGVDKVLAAKERLHGLHQPGGTGAREVVGDGIRAHAADGTMSNVGQ